jgi:hypothetical protein
MSCFGGNRLATMYHDTILLYSSFKIRIELQSTNRTPLRRFVLVCEVLRSDLSQDIGGYAETNRGFLSPSQKFRHVPLST